MVARTETKVPWIPLVLLIFGVIIFWIAPKFQAEQDFISIPPESQK